MTTTLTEVPSETLVAALKEMARIEHRIDRDALLHLYELDRRGDIAREGFDDVAVYCVEELEMKEKAARARAKALHLMKTWPRCVDMIADRSLTMSSLNALFDVLTADNADHVLDTVAGMSEAETELYLMTDFGAKTRRIGFRVDQEWQADYEELRSLVPRSASGGIAKVLRYAMRIANEVLRERRRAAIEPLADVGVRPSDAKVQDPDAMDGPVAADDTSADVAESPAAAMPDDASVAAVRRILPIAADRRNAVPFATIRQHIPAALSRAVRRRDGDCCTYVSPSGRPCRSRRNLEIHHIIPVAHGGPPTMENLTMMCRVHNMLMAIDDFGLEHMEAKRRK